MELTLAEAAKTVKRSKQALAVAIQKGRLSASKDANGQWRIDSAELFRVYSVVNQTIEESGRCLVGLAATDNGEVRELRGKIEALETLRRADQARADELREERDAWRRQAEALMRALPPGGLQEASGGLLGHESGENQGSDRGDPENASEGKSRPSWWQRLWRREPFAR